MCWQISGKFVNNFFESSRKELRFLVVSHCCIRPAKSFNFFLHLSFISSNIIQSWASVKLVSGSCGQIFASGWNKVFKSLIKGFQVSNMLLSDEQHCSGFSQFTGFLTKWQNYWYKCKLFFFTFRIKFSHFFLFVVDCVFFSIFSSANICWSILLLEFQGGFLFFYFFSFVFFLFFFISLINNILQYVLLVFQILK